MNGVKHILFLLLLALLWLPLLHWKWQPIADWPLDGYSEPIPSVEFTLDRFVSGDYADATEQFMKANTPLRSHLIRIRNQMYYSLFGIAKANSVVIGEGGMLLDSEYIDAYYGDDFAGELFLTDRLRKWKELQDTLLKHGTHAVIVFLPGKASFFPDAIPQQLRQYHKPMTNYDFMRAQCDSFAIAHVDLKAHFHAMTDTSRYPLFTKGGIHWSEYGAMLAQLHLSQELGTLLTKNLRSLELRVELDTEPRGTDNDIEIGMNLLFPLTRDTLAYATATYPEEGHCPSLLAIGDSYYWNLFTNGFADRLCRHGGFWFYFREAHPRSVFNQKPVEELDLRTEVLKNEVLMLLMTEPQLPRFGWGSVDTLHGVFCTPMD